eukprot:6184958-Pleurochrysis_carterae.AAC.11
MSTCKTALFSWSRFMQEKLRPKDSDRSDTSSRLHEVVEILAERNHALPDSCHRFQSLRLLKLVLQPLAAGL